MTRKEIYQRIKNDSDIIEFLKEQNIFNYTHTSNKVLEKYIKEYDIIIDFKKNQHDSFHLGYEYSHCSLDKLVEVLEKKRILLKSEVDYIKA